MQDTLKIVAWLSTKQVKENDNGKFAERTIYETTLEKLTIQYQDC